MVSLDCDCGSKALGRSGIFVRSFPAVYKKKAGSIAGRQDRRIFIQTLLAFTAERLRSYSSFHIHSFQFLLSLVV